MRTIIAGSRTITSKRIVERAIDESGIEITQIVSGGAAGVDQLAQWIAKERDIPFRLFPADWHTYGRAAGMIRNKQMAENADALIAVWDGVSRGTKGMIDIAKKLGLKVFIFPVQV